MPTCEDNDTQWTLAFTPDGNRLLAGAAGKVNVWDFKKQRKIFSQATAGTGYIQCLAISPDSKHFAAIPSSAGQDLQVFRLPP
jgi:WD40 repeat protein